MRKDPDKYSSLIYHNTSSTANYSGQYHSADSYNGITGNTSLNQFGDRKNGDYDFWAVRNSGSTHDSLIWKRIGKYMPNVRAEEEFITRLSQ